MPLSKAKSSITSLFECQLGTELESMYLLGDFGVYSVSEPTMNGLLRYHKNSILSWTNSGAGKDWYLHTDTDSDTWTNSYNQPKLGVLGARIEIEE